MRDLISVIITTYEREDALAVVLRALSRQTDRDFEVVVADDGSGPRTAALIDEWKSKIGVPLTHVWHEKQGFRVAEVRNRGLMASRGSYCIFLDGDCVARPDFIAAHRWLAEPGWFVCGNRVLLSRALTEHVLQDGVEPETWSLRHWAVQRLSGGVNRVAPLLTLRIGSFRKLRARVASAVRSCNFGAWRDDLLRVNGFDASFKGWGREDTDLVHRMFRSGVFRKDGTFAAGVLHLWHPNAPRAQLADNERALIEAAAADRVQATTGVMSLRTGGEAMPTANIAGTRT